MLLDALPQVGPDTDSIGGAEGISALGHLLGDAHKKEVPRTCSYAADDDE